MNKLLIALFCLMIVVVFGHISFADNVNISERITNNVDVSKRVDDSLFIFQSYVSTDQNSVDVKINEALKRDLSKIKSLKEDVNSYLSLGQMDKAFESSDEIKELSYKIYSY
ncbi:MAG: hypothetical protein WC755_05810, partial [Candidatus Woesearchaeota archaeon]